MCVIFLISAVVSNVSAFEAIYLSSNKNHDYLRPLTWDWKQVRGLVCNEIQNGSLYKLYMLISLYCISVFIVLPTVISDYCVPICI